MLRVSAQVTETEIDLQGVNGDAKAADTGVQYGAELMQFAETFARRDDEALTTARNSLLSVAGEAVLVDAAGVAANWHVTSDSLAAWLAVQLSIDHLILVKAAEFSAGSSIQQLSTLGIIDQAFAEFVQYHPLTIDCITYHQFSTLAASLKKHA